MESNELNVLLIQKLNAKNDKIKNYQYSISELELKKLRDILIEIGKIYYEDIDNSIYIARIYGGWFKKNPAFLAMKLKEKTIDISAFANEGLFNQHTIEDAINEFKKKLDRYIK